MALVSRTGRQLQRYNHSGRRLVVGCIPYRYKGSCDNGEVEGGWELDESLEEAAYRESLEEAGVLGSIEGELGTWIYESKSHDAVYEGCMFSLLVTKQLDLWPEKNMRQRVWKTIEEAKEVCNQWWMKEALDVLVERLSAAGQTEHRKQKI
ncbi:Nudix hydrolase 17, mitochondrial-like protein [Drosera capensis]